MDPASTTAAPPVVAWHAASAREAGSRLGVGLGGLDGAEAERRLRAVGSNVIHARRGEPAVRVLVRQLSSPLIVVLLVAGVVAIALGDYVDGLVVLAVVAVNTAIGFLQEWRAARSIEALDAMLADDAAVVRDGRLQHVAAADVVPGDLLTLAAGDRVAADARIVAARLLEVDESPLTGESLPVAKQEAAVDTAAPLGDRSSMVHGGTLVAAGTATAVVVATGPRTELGRIADLLAQTRRVGDAADPQPGRVLRALSGAICAIALLLAVVGLVRGYEPMDAALAAIALAVAAIPEGLPAIVTIALASASSAWRGACGHPPAARGRDARVHHGDLHRQDRHADPQPDAGRGAVDPRRRGVARRGRDLTRPSTSCSAPECCAATPTGCSRSDGGGAGRRRRAGRDRRARRARRGRPSGCAALRRGAEAHAHRAPGRTRRDRLPEGRTGGGAGALRVRPSSAAAPTPRSARSPDAGCACSRSRGAGPRPRPRRPRRRSPGVGICWGSRRWSTRRARTRSTRSRHVAQPAST